MGVVRGHVAGVGGQPRAGIRVYFKATPGPEPEVAAVTDENGSFVLSVRHVGEYEIGAADDSGRSVSEKFTASGGDINLRIDLLSD